MPLSTNFPERLGGERLYPVPIALLLPLVGITISELALFHGNIEASLWGHFLILLLCVFTPLVLVREIRVLQAFALVPLFRLVNLGIPVFVDFTLYWLPLIYAPMFPAIYLVSRSQTDLSIRLNPLVGTLLLIPGVALAAFFAEIWYILISPQALILEWSQTQLVLIAVVMIGFVGLVEELLFRAILQRVLQARIGRWTGLLIASLVFGLMHSVYATDKALFFGAAVGVVLGLLYDWSDSIGLVAGVHGLMNIFLFAVIPLQGPVLGVVL